MSALSFSPTTGEAIALQEELGRRVIERVTFGGIRTVAGVDVSVRGGTSYAAIAVLSFPGLDPVETVTAKRKTDFPYIPGLLAFREVPVIKQAFEKLKTRPDMLIIDGQGRAHPRGFGVACHVGVELDTPSIGCAKSRLVGEYREPATERGSRTALRYNGEIVGSVVRTREGVKPVFVSIGHRIDLETAVVFIMRTTTRYRLPEPIRMAHRAAGEAK